MGSNEELNRAGLVAIGLRPEWVEQGSYTGAPATTSAGVFLVGIGDGKNTAGAQGQVNSRELVHRREGRITVDVFDLLLGIYSITIQGQLVTYNTSSVPPADDDALILAIVDAINAGPAALTDDVLAAVDPADPAAVLLTGKNEADWSLNVSLDQDGGTAEITVTASASAFDVRAYTTPGGIIRDVVIPETGLKNAGNPDGWAQPANAVWLAQTWRGWNERLDISGRDRMYLEVYNLTGHPSDVGVTLTIYKVMVGPHVITETVATA